MWGDFLFVFKYRRQGVLIAFFVSVFCLWLAGCGFLQTGKTKELPYLQAGPEGSKTAGQPLQSFGPEQVKGQDVGEQAAGKTEVVLYFADGRGHLVALRKEIPKVVGIARRTLRELCQGPPPESGLFPTIPPGAWLKDINIKDGLAIVDFSQHLKLRHPGGSTGELLTVYSIVNTLTQFPTVKEVQILIEGERVQTLAGHLDISKPLQREGSLIEASGAAAQE